eukprot:TRINITY_DN6983_c0_g1_i37.p1 TRINITY_DN6983_c0_g1~~TRINITY_DN6983_c0_g1_i37.p1  ORF type:complete len:1263 (+),score=274.06 TRINITY_DN6983_c0_g1_i37:3-3791(+)
MNVFYRVASQAPFDLPLSAKPATLVECVAVVRAAAAARGAAADNCVAALCVCTRDGAALRGEEEWRAHEGSVVVLTSPEQQLTAPVAEDEDFTPHPAIMTDGGKHCYYELESDGEGKGKKPFPLAFAEFVDNSIGATVTCAKRVVRIFVIIGCSPGDSYIVVLDNGVGMDSKALKEWATIALSPEERKIERRESGLPCFLDSNISRFGVGSKLAAFYLGRVVNMTTKRAGTTHVHEFCINSAIMKERRQDHESPYVGRLFTREVGNPMHNVKELREVFHFEKKLDSFSYITISELNFDALGLSEEPNKQELEVMQQTLVDTLKSIYCYYVDGPPADIIAALPASPAFGRVHLSLHIRLPRGRRADVPLDEYGADSTSRVAHEALSDPPPLCFRGAVGGAAVVGIASYFPFNLTETLPLGAELPITGPTLRFFWSGRLIPYERVTVVTRSDKDGDRPDALRDNILAFSPNKSSAQCRIPPECYRRTVIQLFFDNALPVTQQKVKFLVDLWPLLRHEETHFSVLRSGSRFEKRNTAQCFTAWLQECHSKSDTEFIVKGDTLKLMRGHNAAQTHTVGVCYEPPSATATGVAASTPSSTPASTSTSASASTPSSASSSASRRGTVQNRMPVLLKLVELSASPEFAALERQPAWLFAGAVCRKSFRELCSMRKLTDVEFNEHYAALRRRLPAALRLYFWEGKTRRTTLKEVHPNSDGTFEVEVEAGSTSPKEAIEVLDGEGHSVVRAVGTWSAPGLQGGTLVVTREFLDEELAHSQHEEGKFYFKGLKVPRTVGRSTVKYELDLRQKHGSVPLNIVVTLTLIVKPGKPASVKLRMSKQVRVGDGYDVHVLLLDKYGNKVREGAADEFTFTCEPKLVVEYADDKITLCGRLPAPSSEGCPSKITVTCGKLTRTKKILVKAGNPVQVLSDLPASVENRSVIPQLLLTLHDQYGNRTGVCEAIQPCVVKMTSPALETRELSFNTDAIELTNVAVTAESTGKWDVTFQLRYHDNEYISRQSLTVTLSSAPFVLDLFSAQHPLPFADGKYRCDLVAGSQVPTLTCVTYDELGNERRIRNSAQYPIFSSGEVVYDRRTGCLVCEVAAPTALEDTYAIPFTWTGRPYSLVLHAAQAGEPCLMCVSLRSSGSSTGASDDYCTIVACGNSLPPFGVNLCDKYGNFIRTCSTTEYVCTIVGAQASHKHLDERPIITGKPTPFDIVVEDVHKRYQKATKHFNLIAAEPHHLELHTESDNVWRSSPQKTHNSHLGVAVH